MSFQGPFKSKFQMETHFNTQNQSEVTPPQLCLLLQGSRTLMQGHRSALHKALMVSRACLLQCVPELSYVLHTHHLALQCS